MDAIGAELVVGWVQELQAGLHVREHLAGDTLDEVVVQHQLLQAPRQGGGHVGQLIVGQVEGLQLPVGCGHRCQGSALGPTP